MGPLRQFGYFSYLGSALEEIYYVSFFLSHFVNSYLLSFAVIFKSWSVQFSENFTILLFHYDGRISEWDEFEWSKRAIHVGVKKQTKWLEDFYSVYSTGVQLFIFILHYIVLSDDYII